MNFASLHFLYFFFVVFFVFYSLPDKWRNSFLLVASYFFYGYWSIKYLVLLIFTMVLDYFFALAIDSAKERRSRTFYLTCSIVANLGILFVFKYLGLFASLSSQLFHTRPLSIEIVLPFGISFYTFHAMSYTIDVYRRVIRAERNFTYYSGYVMFFPQLVAGPIARASHLLHQFAEPKRLRAENVIEGSWLVAKGFFMKVVIADHLAAVVDAYFGSEVAKTPFLVTQAVYFFAFQIYFDFAGYSNIARGVAKYFDYELVINFDRPYESASITEFWRRWHISLSTWLRDYLYISLGGNRLGQSKTYRNLMITMLLGGLWHGANWTFLAWGGIHGTLLCVEKLYSTFKIKVKIPRFLGQIVTFHLVCVAWIFFRSASFDQAMDIIRLTGQFFTQMELPPRAHFLQWLWAPTLGFLIFEWLEKRLGLFGKFRRLSWGLQIAAAYSAIVTIVLFAELNPKAFIYFQF